MNKVNYKLINFCEFDKYAVQSYCAIHDVSEELNLGDITQVNEKEIDDFNVMVGGSPCFLAGEKVNTINGFVNIENLKIGDFVKSHDGSYNEVVSTMQNLNNKIYDIQCSATHNINTTNNHPFLVLRSEGVQYVEAQNLNTSDYMMIPINKNCNEIKWEGVELLYNNRTEISNKLPLCTSEFWYLIGRFIGDGWVTKRKERGYNISGIKICCAKNELETLKNKLGDKLKYCVVEDKSTYKLQFTNKELGVFCSQFGIGAKNKKIPQNILDLKVNYLKHLLEGIIDSDGCYTQERYKVTTVSRDLAYNIGELVLKAKKLPYKIYKTNRPKTHKIEGRIVNQKNTYQIVWKYKYNNKINFIDNDYFYSKIRKINIRNELLDVYNIEVKNTHTYCVNNISTHNCQDFSVAGKQGGAKWTCIDCEYEYNPLEAHYTKRDKCPQCESKNIEKTRSSLLVEWLRILREKKPNLALYENVKNIIGKKFKATFDLFEKELNEYGYNTYYKVLNAKNYGIPQNRERVYLLIIKKELDNELFLFPKQKPLSVKLKDLLECNVEEKFYINKTYKLLDAKVDFNSSCMRVANVDLNGHDYLKRVYSTDYCSPTLPTGSGGNHEPKILEDFYKSRDIREYSEYSPALRADRYPNSDKMHQSNTFYDSEGISQTLDTCQGGNRQMKTLENKRVRKLTPKEYWRLMGFTDDDINKCIDMGISNSQLYKMAGNSIVVDVLYYILLELYNAMPYLLEDIKLSSFFSGIGAFEKAIIKLQKTVNQ